jgi:hypothetical protein
MVSGNDVCGWRLDMNIQPATTCPADGQTGLLTRTCVGVAVTRQPDHVSTASTETDSRPSPARRCDQAAEAGPVADRGGSLARTCGCPRSRGLGSPGIGRPLVPPRRRRRPLATNALGRHGIDLVSEGRKQWHQPGRQVLVELDPHCTWECQRCRGALHLIAPGGRATTCTVPPSRVIVDPPCRT